MIAMSLFLIGCLIFLTYPVFGFAMVVVAFLMASRWGPSAGEWFEVLLFFGAIAGGLIIIFE